MTDEELGKLATEAAKLGKCDRGGLLELFKVVKRDTARECERIADWHTRTTQREFIGAAAVRDGIRARFSLTPTPEGSE